MTYTQGDLAREAPTFIKLWREAPKRTNESATSPTPRRSRSHIEADFVLKLHMLTCVHGEAGPVPASAGFNKSMKQATFVILEVIIFTVNYAPCRYESLEVDLTFRNYEDRAPGSKAGGSTTTEGVRPPHVVSLAPWQEEQCPSAQNSNPPVARPAQLRRRLTTEDYAQSDNPERLKFFWENTARNERCSFPTGNVTTVAHKQFPDVHNSVHWSLTTDNDPLNEWQRTTRETQTTGYTHNARTAFALLLQRQNDETFFVEMELKVQGDVYKKAEKKWDIGRTGETLPGNVIIVFQPESRPVQDTYWKDGEAGKVDAEELGYWTEAKKGRLEVLKVCPVFRPLRVPGQD